MTKEKITEVTTHGYQLYCCKGCARNRLQIQQKVLKQGTAPAIPESKTITLTGNTYRLGFARKDINPEEFGKKTYYIAGHGSGHVMEGVLTDVFVHAVWIDVGSDEGIVWLSGDIVGLTNI